MNQKILVLALLATLFIVSSCSRQSERNQVETQISKSKTVNTEEQFDFNKNHLDLLSNTQKKVEYCDFEGGIKIDSINTTEEILSDLKRYVDEKKYKELIEKYGDVFKQVVIKIKEEYLLDLKDQLAEKTANGVEQDLDQNEPYNELFSLDKIISKTENEISELRETDVIIDMYMQLWFQEWKISVLDLTFTYERVFDLNISITIPKLKGKFVVKDGLLGLQYEKSNWGIY